MNRRPTALLTALLGCLCLASGKKEEFTVTFHLEADHRPQGENVVFPSRVGDPPRETLFFVVPLIDHTDFAAFKPFKAPDGTSGALIQLDHGATRRLLTTSASKQGAYIRTLVNGRPVDSLLIDSQIEDGRIVVWRGLSDEVIALLKQKYPVLK